MTGRIVKTLLEQFFDEAEVMAKADKAGSGKPKEVTKNPVYHSALAEAIKNINMTKASGTQWANTLKNNMSKLGIKKEELEYYGLIPWLNSKGTESVTKDELSIFMISKGEPKLEETIFRDGIEGDETPSWDEMPSYTTNHPTYVLEGGKDYKELAISIPLDQAKALELETLQTKLDDIETTFIEVQHARESGDTRFADSDDYFDSLINERDALVEQIQEINSGMFRGSHLTSKVPNILVHIRFNSRVDADGKRVFFIEEIQSDWATQGKGQGFNDPKRPWMLFDNINKSELFVKQFATKEELIAYRNKLAKEKNRDVNTYMLDHLNDLHGYKDNLKAPMILEDSTAELALKRALKYATDEGYDRVAWTTGKQQIDRYNDQLRQNVDEIKWSPIPNKVKDVGPIGTSLHEYRIDAKDGTYYILSRPDGTVSLHKDMVLGENEIKFNSLDEAVNYVNNKSQYLRIQAFKGDIKTFDDGFALNSPDLEKYLGKEMAAKVRTEAYGSMTGDNLSIGGQFHKQFYDTQLSSIMKRLTKGQVYDIEIPTTEHLLTPNTHADDIALGAEPTVKAQELERVHAVDLTPEVKSKFSKTQPLFTLGAGLAGTGLALGMAGEAKAQSQDKRIIDLSKYRSPFDILSEPQGITGDRRVIDLSKYKTPFELLSSVRQPQQYTEASPESMYEYMTKSKGLSREHALGILANIKGESGFDPAAVNPTSGASGLFQWLGPRLDEKTLGLVNNKDWKGQIDHAITEDVAPQYFATQFPDADAAAAWWMRKWERPQREVWNSRDLEHSKFNSEFIKNLGVM